MKPYIYLTLCLIFFSCGQTRNSEDSTSLNADSAAARTDSVPQNSKSGTLNSNPLSVEEIKQRYAIINDKLQRGLLDSISFKYDCNQERNGTITYFSDKGQLTMIKHSYNEYSHFSAVDLYFVSNNTLFFAHFKRVSWSFESGQAAEGATKDDITEQRLYIVKEKPLLCLEKKYIKRSHSSDNPRPEDVQSKEVKCNSIAPVLKDFGKLIDFKDSDQHDCLEK
ncbi:hypothetical protein [Arcticibacter tournemirensis]|uniref:Lipoprotein n=1 Tax=Arcticibacter tournemirensis TaxID=699437 RepID=A0A4Q0M4L9_9SPHI|nr:hypothetical protein [Arcticibacter tournemirensis]RXF67586.1 hypothetical protein EKH83_18550 [Arcticibacter tournemirensis]